MIKLVDVSKYYKTETTVVMGLHKINLEFNIGEFVAITGESGSGKSTLLNVISGVDSYEDGELYIDNEETSYYSQADFEKFRKEQVAFIFQSYNLIENYTVLQNVEASLIIKNVEKNQRIRRAKDIIERVGLTSRIKAKTSKLSGGEKQRLAIARALAQDTRFIVADEPTGNLDSKSGESVLKLLHELSKDKLIIIVTHNYEQVEPYITRKVRLFDGEVVEDKVIKQSEAVSEDILKDSIKPKKNFFKIPFKFASLNLLSQPKKTFLILLVAIMTTFFIFVFYGGYATIKSSLTDFDYNYNYNSFEERVIINKRKDEYGNKIPLTNSDYDYLNSLNNVNQVVKYEQGLDTTFNIIIDELDFDFKVTDLYGGLPNAFPISLITENDLMGGRLPENDNEIIISYLPDYKKSKNQDIAEKLNTQHINSTAELSFKNFYLSNNPTIKNLKIVGIMKENTSKFGVFIGDNILKDISNLYNFHKNIDEQIVIKYNLQDEIGKVTVASPFKKIGIDYSFTNDIFSPSNELKQTIKHLKEVNNAINIEYYYKEQKINIEENLGDSNISFVNRNLLNEESVEIFQYSLVVKDISKLKSVMTNLNNNGYNGLSSFLANENVDRNLPGELMIISIGFGIYAIFLLIIVYLFSYLSIRTILLSGKKNYNIFRVLGVSPKEIQIMSGIEVVICFFSAYLFNLILFVLFKHLNVKYVSDFVANIKFSDYMLLLVVNIILSFFVANRYSKLLAKRSLMATVKVGG